MPGMPSTEHHNLTIEGFDYVLILREAGDITLALTGGHIPGKGTLDRLYREYDPFEKWEDYEPGIELFGDIQTGINAFRLMREVRGRINGWINRTRPSYFILSPNTERKALIYGRVSALIARRTRGYEYQKIGTNFYFFRLSDSVGQEISAAPSKILAAN